MTTYHHIPTYVNLPTPTNLHQHTYLPMSTYQHIPIPKYHYKIAADLGAGIGLVGNYIH